MQIKIYFFELDEVNQNIARKFSSYSSIVCKTEQKTFN